MNVLITGGLGFIGAALANRLCLEHNVTVRTRSEKGYARLARPEKVRLSTGPVESMSAKDCEGIELIFHCASTVDNYNILTDPYLDVRTNCEGTIALLEACKASRPKLVFVSTFFVYGNALSLPVDENSRCEPLGLYPATKLCAEQFCKVYGRLYDIHVNVCRLTNVYGPGEAFDNPKKAALNTLIRKAYNGEPIDLYDGGDFFRDYLYIEDAVEALMTVAARAPAGELYLVGSGTPLLFKEMIDCLHRLTEKRSELRSIPPPRFHEVVGIRNFSANTGKIRSLGWAPKTDIEQGLRMTVASYESGHS
ncbi:MAG TPA: NAD-dependent epimerase/dehydratase family protein [Nitrospirales bacterium]|jgi:nucleoside-diphosphate-sugar epimerase